MTRPPHPPHPAIDLQAWEQATTDPTVGVVDGHDIRLTVRAGRLHITDGPPRHPRTRTVERLRAADHRILILAGHGVITLEALRWLRDTRLPWAVVDEHSTNLVATSPPATTDARLLRAQASAPYTDTALRVTRYLLEAKLAGQARILATVLSDPVGAASITATARALQQATSITDCLHAESRAAIVYWKTWEHAVTVPFPPSGLDQVPPAWARFTGRPSRLWDHPRNNGAVTPVNAMLNYAYRVAETMAVHACHALGLHPALGIAHGDKTGRDSMALDLIEAVRPVADQIILTLMDTGMGPPLTATGRARYTDTRWFTQSIDGQCRLQPPLTHYLAGHARVLADALRPVAVDVARMIGASADGEVSLRGARTRADTRYGFTPLRPATLPEGTTLGALMPGRVWDQVAPVLPPLPSKGPAGRKYIPDRDIAAALVAHVILRIPWSQLPDGGPSKSACTARLRLWRWAVDSEGVSAWDKVTGIVNGAGYLQGLTVTRQAG